MRWLTHKHKLQPEKFGETVVDLEGIAYTMG